jgi:hypothetical protein
MRTAGVLLALLLTGPQAPAAPAPGSMPIAVPLAELATAAGIQRADPSTLPLDIVRTLFAAPEVARDQLTVRRQAVVSLLSKTGGEGDRLPLPLSPDTWRKHILRAEVADGRLAAAIFSRRATALLYHGLFALDPPTLEWIDAHPAVLEILLKHPGITAACARSIHVKDGVVVTPGDDANGVWKAIVGADPRGPESFIAGLIGSRDGRLAVFYDAVTHLDAAHRRFVLGRATDANRIERLRRLIEAGTRDTPGSGLELYPFKRPDIDLALLFGQIALDGGDRPIGPPISVWRTVFGEPLDFAQTPADAVAFAAVLLKPPGAALGSRRTTYLLAQRVFPPGTFTITATLVEAMRGVSNYPALMLVLESNGFRSADQYAAAARAAAALGGDDDALALFQGTLAIVDRTRQAGALSVSEAQTAIDSLVRAATVRPARAALLHVLRTGLPSRWSGDIEAAVLRAMAGAPPSTPVLVDWEGQQYSVDLARPELHRLTSIRRRQQEASLGDAIAAATPDNMSALVNSLRGLAYAAALGEPDAQAAHGGQVWRRHRFGSAAPGAGDMAWQLATEEFGGASGWRLTGSLLRLDLALAHLALRRLDPTEMPAESAISAIDRRTLARTIAMIDAKAIGDEARDAAASALARGRARVAALAAHPETLDMIAGEAALSEWRLSGLRWLLVNDAARVPGSFTLLELFRLGGGKTAPGWGAAADALGGCYCLRMPDRAPWEEYAGRPSSGQLATQFVDVMLRTAEALATRRLPAALMRDVAAFAMQDTIDSSRMTHFDDWLSLAFAARDLKDERFDDYVAALTASGPLVPVRKHADR